MVTLLMVLLQDDEEFDDDDDDIPNPTPAMRELMKKRRSMAATRSPVKVTRSPVKVKKAPVVTPPSPGPRQEFVGKRSFTMSACELTLQFRHHSVYKKAVMLL